MSGVVVTVLAAVLLLAAAYGAMPVPVATMIRSTSGVCSGISMVLPVGPVMATSVPAFASHRKLDATPFFAGSSLPSSLSQ